MTRPIMSRAFGVTTFLTCLLLARPTLLSAQILSPAVAPIPAPPRRDTMPPPLLRVTTPPPSTVRPTGVRAAVRPAQPPAPVAVVAPSPAPNTLRQAATFIPGPPTPAVLARAIPSPIASSIITPAQRVASADAPPPTGATMRCKDGTFLTGAASEQRCAGNGGLSVTFPVAPATPQPPVRRP